MIGASATQLTEAFHNRKPGQTVIYCSTDDGGYWITVTGAATTNYPLPDHDPYPWEDRLKDIVAMGAKFHKDFAQAFRGGLIPHKGYGGITQPVQDLSPPITTAAPAPDDRRRDIRAIYTVRPIRVP